MKVNKEAPKNIMKKAILSVCLLSTLINGCSNTLVNMPGLSQTISTEKNSFDSKDLLVKFKTGFNENNLKSLTSIKGIKNFKMVSKELKIGEINLNESAESETIKSQFIKSGFFEYVEEDQVLKLDPDKINNSVSNKSFSVKSNPEEDKWPLDSINARKLSNNTFPNNITVAVIDSGIDSNHPDLKDVILPLIDIWNEEEGDDIFNAPGVQIDFKGRDGNGHGTHVSGIINSVIKSMEISNISILPIKAANHTGNTSGALITKAILKAIDKGARVINLSIGGPSSEGTQALQDTIDFAFKKGIVIVASSGNDSVRRRDFVKEVSIPSAYPGVISVAASNKHDVVSDYSNGGPEIDISAPGGEDIATDDSEKISSAWPTYQTFVGYTSGIKGNHASFSGTSMACPYVSATAALLLAKNSNLSSSQVRLRLLSTADDIEEKGFDNASGFGKLNVFKAISDDTDDLR